MNQIHEKDWAEDDWGWHSGMQSCIYDGNINGTPAAEQLCDDARGSSNIVNAVSSENGAL